MFAYGKLIEAILKIRDEVKPTLEISSGSWRMEYIKYADVFFPEEVPLLPLDRSIVFDTPEVKEILSRAAEHRKCSRSSGPTMMITAISGGHTGPGRTWQISWQRGRPADLASFTGRQGPWTFISRIRQGRSGKVQPMRTLKLL